MNNIDGLFKAKDESKDQSYFLFQIKEKDLDYLYFPLGDLSKEETRLLAKKYEIPIIALGLGEKEDDLQLFEAEKFAEAFIQIN